MHWALFIAAAAAASQQAWPSHVRDVPRAVPQVVAIVNGTRLLSDRLDAAVNVLLPQESFHRNVGGDTLAELRRRALQQIVDDELQYQDALSSGLVVPEAAVDEALNEVLARYPSQKAFTLALANAGATLADMRRELRRMLLIRAAYGQRVTARCQVDRDEAQHYFQKHPERFLEPERLHIQAITIGADPSGGEKAWSAARERANQVHRLLVAGAAFDALAQQYSTDATGQAGGDMGLLHRGSLDPAFESVLASLKPGEVGPVVETIYGYHIIRLTEVLPPRPRSFEDVGARLQRDLTDQRCASAKDTWIAALRAAAAIAYPQ